MNTPNSGFESVATPDATPPSGDTTDQSLVEAPDHSLQSATTDPATGIEIVPQSDEPVAEVRTSSEGRWEMVLHMFESELIGLLVDIEKTDGGYQIETVGDSPSNWTLSESNITDDEVHLKITDPRDIEIDFRGRLEDGVIRGNIAFSAEGLDLASLRPTTKETLTAETSREPASGLEQIAELKSDENLLTNMRDIAQNLGDAPLAYALYVRIFNIVRNQPPNDWDYPALVDEYVAAGEGWGERVQARVNLDVGYTLAIIERAPELAHQHLDMAAEELGDIESEGLASRMALSRGLLLINSESEEDQQAGYALLEQVKEKDPFNLVSVVKMAAYQEAQGNNEEALALYASLTTVPGIRGDISKIANLWKELGRDPQELDAYLDEVYQKAIYHFAETDGSSEPAADNQQVVLGELFTGAACPPCVAADIATGGLELAYPSSKFVMLRYHEHVPAPDPMTIADGEARLLFYEARGTPSLYINGTGVQGVGGNVFNAAPLYKQLRTLIDPLTEQTTDLSINLTAEGNGDTLHVGATVDGAEEYPESWRLRLCLVEEAVSFPAPNGIRIHEMLVRYMPGGAEGILPREDGFAFEADITAAEIHQTLQATIDTAQERYNVDLPQVPNQLDSLHFVAFVQDDLSLEVKQAASIPIIGFDAGPPAAEEAFEETETDEDASLETPTAKQDTDSTEAPEPSDPEPSDSEPSDSSPSSTEANPPTEEADQ